MSDAKSLAADLLIGAPAIAAFLYGDPALYRKVYALKKSSTFPVFRLGRELAITKSTALAWIRKQEARAGAGLDE